MNSTSEQVTVSSSPSNIKLFNRDLYDIRDPLEFAGIRQNRFCISFTYEVGKKMLPQICDELYSEVVKRAQEESVSKVSIEVNDYLDASQQGKEQPRRYIVISRETNRSTRCGIFVRFLPFGDHLYIGVDSYVLGAIDWIALVVRLILTLIPLFILFSYLSFVNFINSFSSPFSSSPFSSRSSSGLDAGLFCCFIPLLLFVVLLWVDTIKAFRQHGNLWLALRQSASLLPSGHSFDVDDTLMFFKSALPLIIFSVRAVLQKYNIPIKSIDDTIIQNINNTVTISSGGGILSIVGSIIGGNNNRAVTNN